MLPLIFLAALPASGLADTPPTSKNPANPAAPARPQLQVSSSAFAANQPIPPEYTCDGAQKSPPLRWSNVPKGTRSIAVLVEDPDAPKGNFTHWLVTGIPPTATSLPAGGALPQGAMAAKNGKGETGYTGPCPPSGRHRYFFRVYALDTTLGRSPQNKDELMSAIDGHVLAEGQLIGTYQKITPP
jgi:Raf kinase inhibitor-like YbhB/YbcL family protein